MSNRTIQLTDGLYEYLLRVSLREDRLLQRLRDETARDPASVMQIAPEQGQFMALLVELMGATAALEIGVFTGYSALCVARALGPGGLLVACDISESWTAVARRYWREAGVADRIDLRIGPALNTLNELVAQGREESFDFAFIDADKQNYLKYYELSLSLLKPGGLVVVDNVLWDGAVIDPDDEGVDTQAIRDFNSRLAEDDRVSLSTIPVGDGLTLARKHG
jgi:predicted O-methyltransferase YrrM